MAKRPLQVAFGGGESTKIRVEYVVAPAKLNPNRATLKRIRKLEIMIDKCDMFHAVYVVADAFVSKKGAALYALFKEKYELLKRPSQAFINYYDANSVILIPKHKDRVPFCSVTVSLTEDDGCLHLWHGAEKVKYPLRIGEYVVYDRVWHCVESNLLKNKRCTLTFFY